MTCYYCSNPGLQKKCCKDHNNNFIELCEIHQQKRFYFDRVISAASEFMKSYI